MMKMLIIIFAFMSYTNLLCLENPLVEIQSNILDSNLVGSYLYLKNINPGNLQSYPYDQVIKKKNETQSWYLDTLSRYFDRSTSFEMYFYNKNQKLVPLTGTNTSYHIIGVKYEMINSNLVGIVAAFGMKLINEPADSLALLISTGDSATGLPVNPIIANTGFSVIDLDTNSSEPVFTPIMLKNSTPINGKIAIMMQIWTETDESDAVVLYSNRQGDAKGEKSSFISIVSQEGIGSYNIDQLSVKMSDGKGPDFDIMILPVIEITDTVSGVYPMINDMILKGLFPNPTYSNAELNFELESKTDIEIQITDLNGKLMTIQKIPANSTGEYSIPFNFSTFPNGSYLYIISTNSSKAAGKFVVSN